MNIFKKIAAFSLILATLAACGPMYDTHYQYVPPRSAEGKMCITSCSAMKQSCKHNCTNFVNMCIVNNNVNRLAAQASKSRYHYDQYCSDYSCRADCDEEYNHCFQNCGGEIIAHTRCVYNCDKAR